MTDFDDPITVEIETSREMTAFLFGMGAAGEMLLEAGNPEMSQAAANLQIRTISDDAERIEQAVDAYTVEETSLIGGEEMSNSAALGLLAAEEERDPDAVGDELREKGLL